MRLGKVFFWAVVITASILFMATSAENLFAKKTKDSLDNKNTLKRSYDPIEIDGEYLDGFLGKPIENIRLMVFKDGKFIQAPFEIDERREDYSYILPMGSQGSNTGANGIVDKQDVLVFMINDAGDRIDPEKIHCGADYISEITLSDPLDRSKGWMYLAYFKDNNIVPKTDFKAKVWLEDNPEVFIVHGTSYVIEGFVNEINGKIYKTAINNRFYVPEEAGGNGVNIFDRMKTRSFTSLFFGLIKLTVNENNVIGELDQYQGGTIRGFGRNWLQVAIPTKIAHLKSPRMYLDIFTYDTMILIPMTIHVLFNPKLLGVVGGMSYGYDLNEKAFGMKFYNSENRSGFVIDGKMSSKEKEMKQKVDEWRCITGPQGTMITSSVWDKAYLSKADIKINYIDDINVNIDH